MLPTGKEASVKLVRILSGRSLVNGAAVAALLAGSAGATPLGHLSPRALPGSAIVRASAGDITGSLGNPVGALPSTQLSTLKSAIASYKKGDLGGGDATARLLTDPAARAAAEWIAIRSASRQVGFARISRFLNTYPNWPSSDGIRARGEEALYNDGVDDATVRASFAANEPQTDEGKVAFARALLRAGETKRAAALIRDAYRNDSLSGSLEGDILKNYGSMLTAADLRYRADRMTYDGNYADALRAAPRAGADMTALVKARIAVAKEAGNAGALLAAVPSGIRSSPAYLFARVSHLRRNDKAEEAAALLAKAPRDAASLVRPDEWWTERRLVARQLLDKGDFKAAYAVAAAYTAETDTTRMEAEFHCGWIALRFLGDARTAARHFAALTRDATRPISLSRGAYWQGRAAEAMKEMSAATGFYQRAARYSTTYYGQIARARLGLKTLDLNPPPSASAAARAAFNTLLAPRAIASLYAIGEDDYARMLVADMAKKLQDSQQLGLLADLASRNKDAKALLSVGKSATQRGLPLDTIAFPLDGIPSFRPVGDVEKAVVYGIARQESEFRHDVVSRAGARGLMQVMPATARATARAAGLAFDAARLTRDPAYNAQIGSAHLGELIGKFGGSYVMTFAAYNAGSSRVAQWVSTYGDPRDPRIDPIDWVERIPYSETRNYVQRVMENVQVYRARLGAKTALLIDRDLRRGGVAR